MRVLNDNISAACGVMRGHELALAAGTLKREGPNGDGVDGDPDRGCNKEWLGVPRFFFSRLEAVACKGAGGRPTAEVQVGAKIPTETEHKIEPAGF